MPILSARPATGGHKAHLASAALTLLCLESRVMIGLASSTCCSLFSLSAGPYDGEDQHPQVAGHAGALPCHLTHGLHQRVHPCSPCSGRSIGAGQSTQVVPPVGKPGLMRGHAGTPSGLHNLRVYQMGT